MTKSQVAHEAEAVVDHAKDQAKAQLDSIREMMAKLSNAETERDALEEIQNDPLSVEVREDWYMPGTSEPVDLAEFKILLCWGGPAVRITGDLDRYKQPETAHIEYQDWGTPWTEYRMSTEEKADVLTYCQCFYFGE